MKWKGIVSQLSQRIMATRFAAAHSTQPRSWSLGRIEAVGGVPDSADRNAFAELLAQAADADVHDVGARVEVVTPDLREQPFAAQHPTRIRGEVVEQLELAVGELDDAVGGASLAPGWVEDELPDLEGVGLIATSAPADVDSDACQELVECKRLRHVVAGTEAEVAQVRA